MDNQRSAFNRPPLRQKPFAELPLGAIEPRGWLRDELRRMAGGMTGHLDEWYPEVCGPRNAWLGGDGDCWERGPYWIDGLYPLAKLLGDAALEAKAQAWIEWTLANQREDGDIGPRETREEDRGQAPPEGAQVYKADDWWPRMVMLKVLQQYYSATGDERVIECLKRYFAHQLKSLPARPLHDAENPASGSWWAAQRGGDNLMVVLWLYNVTGDGWLLELADLLHEQTVPVTQWFLERERVVNRADQGPSLHCVNLAQMMKTPAIRFQQDRDETHLRAIEQAFRDLRRFHGQPQGLYGADESLHGDAPDRGSELCTAVEMMFSLEKIIEITGDAGFGDRLERIAFNALPTQVTRDYRARQYFQQTNQALIDVGNRDFFQDCGLHQVYSLLGGYPCCTCNLHQGWPKFAQHLWMATADGGLAAVAYAPSRVVAQVGRGAEVAITLDTGYPFQETLRFRIDVGEPARFPLKVRIPGWCENAALNVNGEAADVPLAAGTFASIERTWVSGDVVVLTLPMSLGVTSWYGRSRAIERGPLVFALGVRPDWREVVEPPPAGVAEGAMHRGHIEARPTSPWNYAFEERDLEEIASVARVEVAGEIPDDPWTLETTPVAITLPAARLPYWTMNRHSAALPPVSPAERPEGAAAEEIRLVPYGATTLRTTVFPWLRGRRESQSD